MANNRMFLVNREGTIKICLGKYYPSTGWFINSCDLVKRLNAAFEHDAFSHLTPEQRAEHAQSTLNAGGQFHTSRYSSDDQMFGEVWSLEYEGSEKLKHAVSIEP